MYASVVHYGGGTGQGGIWMTNDLNNLGTSNWVQLPEPVSRLEGHPASIVVLNDGTMVCTYSGRRNAAGTFTTSSGGYSGIILQRGYMDRCYACGYAILDKRYCDRSVRSFAKHMVCSGIQRMGWCTERERGFVPHYGSWCQLDKIDRFAIRSCYLHYIQPAYSNAGLSYYGSAGTFDQ